MSNSIIKPLNTNLNIPNLNTPRPNGIIDANNSLVTDDFLSLPIIPLS